MIPDDLVDRAHDCDILAIAEQLLGARLKRVAAAEFVGPCVVCGGTDRFGVNVRRQVWNCRGCVKGGDVIALMMHVEGVSLPAAIERLTGERWSSVAPPVRRRPAPGSAASQDEDAARKSRSALRIFNGARSVRRTPGETNLVRWRNIDIDQIPDLDEVLRFEAHCPFGGDNWAPCLISLVRNILTDAPQAIQRVALDGDGRKIDRLSLGPTKGGAIKLWPDAEVTVGLVVGEGLETTAAAATRPDLVNPQDGTLLQPAWALIDRINLRDLPILAGVESLTILVDNDASGDGQAAAARCAARWNAAGREVTELTPNAIGDFNDIVRSGA